jgi:HK97 family phage major capsid protein
MRDDIAAAVAAGTKTLSEAIAEGNQRMEAIESRIAAIEDNSRRQTLPGSADARGTDGKTFMFMNVIRSLALRSTGVSESIWRAEAELEWEMSDQLRNEQRAMGVSPDSAGGFLVPGEVLVAQLIEKLRPRLIATLLGATEADFVTTPVDIPKEVTDPDVDALAENESGNASDAELGQLRLEPHTAQSYMEISRRLLFAGTGVETILVRMMTKAIAVTWNEWALKGTGGKQPVGIFNTLGIGSVDFSGVTIGANDVGPDFYQTMLLFEERLRNADAFAGAGKLGWAIPVKMIRAMMQVKSENAAAGTQSLDMARNTITTGTDRVLLGYNYETSTQLLDGAESEVIFGDWESLIMATFGNMILEASNVADQAMRKRQTHIVAAIDVDTAVTQPGAFAVSSGLNLATL